MLQNSFLHLSGIGTKGEQQLWARGINTWDQYEKAFESQRTLFTDSHNALKTALAESRKALSENNTDFFAEHLPKSEHYRIALSYPKETLFLDIESTGLSRYYDEITLVGISLNGDYFCYLPRTHKKSIRDLIESAKCLVTFNGSIFDLKFIEQEFKGIKLPKAHVDLRFFAKRLGHPGGQKVLEKKFGFLRPGAILETKGEQAPVLWHEYQLGNIASAQQLVRYNQYDVVGMQFLFDRLLAQLLGTGKTPASIDKISKFSTKPKKLSWTQDRKKTTKHRIYLPKKIGGGRPKITYKMLAKDLTPNKTRFIGIDLTGSEKRATGWCFLDGNHAITKLISSDADIVAASMAARPDVVSIDSPLSLPEGRISVGDDDPGRDKYGIMRVCERILKKRGVNVYPALIPSMQGLTARGMRLAAEFRSMGVPVIESYPGAAQDIMGLPRKGASLQQLGRGMEAFGITGDYTTTNISHDELDAITSAAVALFFWSGCFEKLGNEIEDYLIIPDLKVSPETWLSRMVVGFSGPIAAGKTTGAEHIAKKSFAYVRFSQILDGMLKAQGKTPNRNTRQELGTKINNHPGQLWFAKQVANFHGNAKKIAVDGLRHPEDHACMVETFGPAFHHFHITADESIRSKRYPQSPRAFQKAIAHPVEQKVEFLKTLSHEILENNGKMKRFTARLNRLISKVSK